MYKKFSLFALAISVLLGSGQSCLADSPASQSRSLRIAEDTPADATAAKGPDTDSGSPAPSASPLPNPSPVPNEGTGNADATQSDGKLAEPENKGAYADEALKHYNRGVELHQSGFLNQAIAEYKAAIDADKRMEEAYSNLGIIYAQQRNYAKATDSFTKALSLKPARPYTLNGLATVLYARGKTQDAMQKWEEAVKIDPNFASAYFNMGNAQENEKNITGALESYAKAIRTNAGMADAYYRIGTIYNRERHAAQASTLLSKALELSPDAEFAREAKRQLDALKGQFAHEQSDEPEVQMNIMAPPSSAATDSNSGTSGASAPTPGGN